MHLFQHFLAVRLSPTLYKFETQKEFWLHISNKWGEVRGWACVNWKMPKKCKSVPRLLSMSEGLLLFITDAPIFWESFFIMQPSLTSTRTNSQFFGTCCASGMWRVMLSATFLHCRECLKKICYSTAAIIIRSTELNLGCFLALETIAD